jgi:hypothetical protein
VDWGRADAREFVEPLAFDLVLNLYTSFGYFASPEEDRKVALNIYQSLKEGGKLVLSTLSKETIVRGFVEHSWDERGDYMVLEHRTLHSEFRAVENQWIVLKGDTRREVGFIVRLYSASEMRVLLEGVGFSHVRFYGSLAGTRYDQNADRMVVVATKG